MFDPDVEVPTAAELLAELGLDTRVLREVLADDRSRRCPDREVPTDRRWRGA